MTSREEKLRSIKEHPDRHHHTFEELQRCCFHGGAVDMQLIEAHETHARTDTNGSRNCDVTSGPCSCGAWH